METKLPIVNYLNKVATYFKITSKNASLYSIQSFKLLVELNQFGFLVSVYTKCSNEKSY